jgi:hypothetical protein
MKGWSRFLSIMLVLPFVAGCSSITVTPTRVSADIKLLDQACSRVGIDAGQFVAAARSVRLDFSQASVPPQVDAVHGRPMAKIYAIDVPSFFAVLDGYASSEGGNVVHVKELKIEIGDNGVTAESAPTFFITLTAMDSHGATFSIRQGAAGPGVADFQGKADRDFLLAQSASVGLLSAFVRVVVATSKHGEAIPGP